MDNVKMTVKANILTVEVDLSKDFGPSKSGKTVVIATTRGNAGVPDNSDVRVGLNVFKNKR